MKLVRHSYFSDYYDANDSANKTLRLLWCALSGSAAIHFVCCCYCCCTTTTRCRRSITARYLSIYPSIHLSVHAIAAVDYDEWTTTKWNTCYDGGAAADIEPMKARILSDSLILLLLLLFRSESMATYLTTMTIICKRAGALIKPAGCHSVVVRYVFSKDRHDAINYRHSANAMHLLLCFFTMRRRYGMTKV